MRKFDLYGEEEIDFISCRICGKKYLQLNHRHLNECHKLTTEEYIKQFNIKSLTCKNYSSKREKTFLERYGVKNQFGRNDIIIDKEKRANNLKKALKNKYGVENPSQIENVKERKKQTFIERYGVSTNLLIDGVNAKSVATTKLKAQRRRDSGEYEKRRKEYYERKRLNGRVHGCMGTIKRHLRTINPHNKSKTKDALLRLGYTEEELKIHLQNNLPEGITWNDFMTSKNVYSLDHIIPKAAYIIKEEFDEEFMKCWN